MYENVGKYKKLPAIKRIMRQQSQRGSEKRQEEIFPFPFFEINRKTKT